MHGDLLPTIYDVAISIFNVASKPKSDKMQQCINAYAESLIDLWIRAFGEDHVLSINPVKDRIRVIVLHYHSNVLKTSMKF